MFKLIVELGPLLIFLVTYKYSDILKATLYMIVGSLVCLLISYIVDKKLSAPLVLSTLIVIVLGCVTVLSGDSAYIKMKPTIVYMIFAAALYIGAIKYNKSFIKNVLGGVISMSDQHWIILAKRFGAFFIFMAIINEVIWRNFSESTWVSFKVIGAIPIAIIFMAMQIPFLSKHGKIDIKN